MGTQRRTAEREGGLKSATQPLHPSTPPTLVDSELTKKGKSSECVSDPPPPPHSSAESNNNNQQEPNNPEKNSESNRERNISENALLIREIISSKLTDMMEQGLGLVAQGPRDFSQHMPAINNNEFVKENQHAALISHMLKMQALNMSKDSDSDRHTESPTHSEDEKEEPINLEHNGRSSGSDGETSPASPSSDAGMSTSSAKDQKASRLENIVGSLGRTTSSPLPAQGANKRKLYQPVRETTELEETKEGVEEEEEEPEQKKMKDGIENHIKSMQDQFVRLQEKFHNHNDENADPETSELHIDTSRIEDNRKAQREEVTIERRVNPKSFRELSGHPLLNGKADPLPIPPTSLNPNYMDLAKRFLQEQQDKMTKEMIMKDIVQSTLARNEIADKLAAISPELDGLADILHSELNTGLSIIVESIVQRFLSSKRQPLGKFSEDVFSHQDRHKTPSGRAPQVRDRSTPRTVANPLSMADPISQPATPNVSNSLVMTSIPSQQGPPRMIPFPASLADDKVAQMPSLYPLPNNNGQLREEESEQDDALNLVVTPKKHKRHKVTDTRITPRTVSRLLGDQPSMAELQKHFGPTSPFMPPGFPLPKLLEEMPRPPFHHLPFPTIPTSAGHPSLPQQFPFSPFGFPGPLGRPRDFSPPEEPRPRSASPPRDHRPPPPLLHPAILAAQSPDFARMKHVQERENDRPVSETSSDDLTKFDSKFDRVDFGNSPFSMASMSAGYNLGGGDSQNCTLTPMHLRKAKLMFFWVRYPSSAIIKMYFPDIKFNKNNTAQLVKWFSNFREFYYIQMEKYARQALSEGIKNPDDLRVALDSELYRVLNLHYNRNNHIEVPHRFRWVIEQTLKEFFKSVTAGKDIDPSWKKQIYKIIARYDEPIPEYFKTQEFLQQLE